MKLLLESQVSFHSEKLPNMKKKPLRLTHYIDSPFQRERKQEINFKGLKGKYSKANTSIQLVYCS